MKYLGQEKWETQEEKDAIRAKSKQEKDCDSEPTKKSKSLKKFLKKYTREQQQQLIAADVDEWD